MGTGPSEVSFRARARELFDRGFSIFPLKFKDKVPAIREYEHQSTWTAEPRRERVLG
jgi:hypothetical protein